MSAAKIADLFFKALLDDGQLQVDAQKSGEKAGQTLGSTMSKRLSSALKTTAFTALAAGSAIAGKGLLELQGITADFRAETGATADEADRAGKAINEMGGRNLQPLKEIGAVLTKVHTDMGLTGAAAEKTTEAFLKYATATRQNATEAVKNFDDILDAWGLTADHATDVMDKLIASHQKYGGSIEENQRALAGFAPQLLALNATIDDGIGLLNLFAASGLDASVAQRALNTAVSKLKPGQNLDDLIRQISAIEDPTKRAQKAVETFGARGGVALANALKPGVTSLSEFAISSTEAAGATQKASDVIEGTFSNQVALKIKAVGAAIIGLGQDFGPVLTGLAGAGSLLGALGPKLGTGLAGAWSLAGKLPLVGTAISRAGELAATGYLKALIAGDAVGAAVSSAWKGLIARPAVAAAISAAGTAAGLLFAAAVVAVPIVVTIGYVTDQAKNVELLNQIGNDAQTATVEALKGMRDRLAEVLAAEKDRFDPIEDFFGLSQQNNLQKQLDAIDSIINDRLTNTGETAGAMLGPAINDGLERAAPVVKHAIATFAGKIKDDLSGVGIAKEARRQGNLAGAAIAQGILEKRNAPQDAWQTLLDFIHNGEKPTVERAKLLGQLASKTLAWALKSGDPAVRAQARATKQGIIDQLKHLGADTTNIGKSGMESLRQALHSKDPEIRAAAWSIYKKVHGPVSKLPATGTAAGKGIGHNLVSQLDDERGPVGRAASRLGNAIARNILGGVLYGGTSSAKTGKDDLHKATGGRVAAGQGYVVGEHRPEFFVPDSNGRIYPSVPAMGSGSSSASGGDTYNVNLLDRMPVHSVRDIGSGLRMLGEQGYLKPRRAGSW